MPVKTSIHIETIRTSTGSQTFTGDLGGDTPTAAEIWLVGVTSTDTTTSQMAMAVGYYDGTNNACGAINSEDGQGTSDAQRSMRTAFCINQTNQGGSTVIVRAAGTSFGANSVTVNFSIRGDSTAWYVICVLYSGVAAQVGNFTVQPTQNATTTITTSGITPRLIKVFNPVRTPDTDGGSARTSNGFACLFEGGILQGSHSPQDRNSQGTMQSQAEIRNDRVSIAHGNTGINYRLEVTQITSGQFQVTTRDFSAPSSTHSVPYLALETDEDEVEVIFMTTRTGAGTKKYTTSFLPNAFHFSGGEAAAFGTVYTNATAEASAFGFTQGTNEFCVAIAHEDNVGTSNTISRLETSAHYMEDGSGTVRYDAVFTSYETDGVIFTYATAVTAAKYVGLAFRAPAVTGGGQLVSNNPLLGNNLIGGKLVG